MYGGEKERVAFWYLCSETDRKKLQQQIPMTYEDFERITYILDTLNFRELGVEFWILFQSQFEKELLDAEQEIIDIEEEVNRYTGWLVAFCKSAPNPLVGNLLKKIFELDGEI